MPVETINFNYLGLAIVFLITTYYWLEHTKQTITKKEKRIAKNGNTGSHIMVTTKKGDIEMDTNVFEHHMRRMKDNIVQLNQKFTQKECSELKKYLENAKIKTKNYIDLNKVNNSSNDFCNLDSRYKLVNSYILQEREMLRLKLETGKSKTILDTDDIDADEIRYSILELLIDIDIIIFLMRSSLCKKGRFDMTSLDQVIIELYNSNCTDGKLADSIESADLYVRPMVSSLYQNSNDANSNDDANSDDDSNSNDDANSDDDSDDANNCFSHGSNHDCSRHTIDRETLEPQICKVRDKYFSHAENESFSDKYYETHMTSKHPLQSKMNTPKKNYSILDVINLQEKNTMFDHNSRSSLM
jgi:hypothetical protein